MAVNRKRDSGFLWVTAAGAVLAASLIPRAAHAGTVEISVGFSYNHDTYTGSDYSWERRWGASAGYYLTELTEFEVGFQDVYTVTSIAGFENTTFHDQIYSLDWVQNFVGKQFPIQPYSKLGIGQLDRTASGSYTGGVAPPAVLDEVTIIIGAGLRLYFTRSFALRSELTTYLVGGAISTFSQNVAFTAGCSIFF